MCAELVQAVFVNILEDGSGAARDPPALSHAVEFAAALGFVLADHVVVVEGAAAGADEERGGCEGRGCGPDFFNFRDVVGHGRWVDHIVTRHTGALCQR